jgi:hypothetical protein
MISYNERRPHGFGGYFKGLDDKGSDKEGNQKGNDDRFRVFLDFRFFFDMLEPFMNRYWTVR